MSLDRPFGFDELVLHPETGVLVPPAQGSAATYLDGSERYLLEALKASRDVGVFSQDLRGHVRDWASLYHLTPYRATIMEAFGFRNRSARVLELGAGCGAVTRWIGEHFDAVDTVEGSLARAQVARERCRDLESVRVAAGNFFDFDFGGAYDVATLIGVLEYSHLYHPEFPGDPARAASSTLGLVRRGLADDGVLVIAIENKFGLKYLAGSHEDHSSRRYDGIEGYPTRSSAVTYGAPELEQLVLAAGFTGCDFYLPFPDYKLATTIVDAALAGPDAYPANWIETPFPDRTGAQDLTPFDEALALREVARGSMLRDLANSFIVLAYNGDRTRVRERLGIDEGWTARHYSLDRLPAYCKRASLERTETGDRVVRNTAVVAGAPAPPAGVPLVQTMRDEEFHPGDQLMFSLHEAAAIGRLAERLPELLERMSRFLVDAFGTGQVDDAGIPLLRGDALDATWWNVVVDPESGEWHVIDREWRFAGLLPLDYVLWRGLHHALNRHRRLLRSLHGASPDEYAVASVAALFGAGTVARFPRFQELESFVQSACGAASSGRPVALGPWTQQLVALGEAPRETRVLAFADELVEAPELLETYGEAFAATDPVTLVAYAPDAEVAEIAERLQSAITEVGCEPDVLLVAVDRDEDSERRLAEGATALLSIRTAGDPFDRMPRFGGGDSMPLRLAALGR